ncbi:hypothetical protein Sliba_61290 [Streptomyces nigrescens]|uniref:Uncharacterized protein n=1 Tax=Streptomyces nigrescens TaxID=1920 RepID=A0A640TU26_STRNI|nr:hypothetical protein Sliba_61290 [Streptomyces libani subsp. libani]GGV98716.1 hypothetical protein GCM10010500_48040 [Streptomyces libani subsp. libani]
MTAGRQDALVRQHPCRGRDLHGRWGWHAVNRENGVAGSARSHEPYGCAVAGDAGAGAADPQHAVRGGHEERQRRTAPALPPMGSLFTVSVHEDERTMGPAPQLREAFAQLEIAIRGVLKRSTAHQDESSWLCLFNQLREHPGRDHRARPGRTPPVVRAVAQVAVSLCGLGSGGELHR